MIRLIFLFLTAMIALNTQARTVTYLEPETLINQFLGDSIKKPQTLWLKKELKEQVKNILGHPYPGIRLKYWRNKQQSLWILDEIGKEQPITVGIIIENQKIKQLRVLIYRETRGFEVHNTFFSQQYVDAMLTEKNKLDRHIDGITGATLSVQALNKLARLALFLDRTTEKKHISLNHNAN
ncbi:MAG: FMN-binding protein [bacterium]